MSARLLPVLTALVACTQPHVPDSRPAGVCEEGAFPRMEHVLQVQVGGRTRRALVWFPPQAGPHDVVVNLHEFRANPRTQVRYSGWADHVAESGAIVVAPDARYAVWNAGECCGRAVEKHVDDVAFLDAVIEELDRVACTSGRVMATGIGNGAMMAWMWSCESQAVDAVVSVGGSLQWRECRNPRPVPLLHYHGSEDRFIPMDAAPVGLVAQEGIERTLEHGLGIWAARNHATEARTVKVGDLHCREFEGAARMTACTVEGGQDTWPGAPDGQVKSESVLADATEGAWAWVQEAWSQGEDRVAPPPPSTSAKDAARGADGTDTDAPAGVGGAAPDAPGGADDSDSDGPDAEGATPAATGSGTPDAAPTGSGTPGAAPPGGATEDRAEAP
jgi:polyhydroxybutyrate depolymerase